MTAPRWRVRVDTGGTFTDCVAFGPDGRFHRAKVLSTSALRFRVREDHGRRLVLDHHEPAEGPDLLRGGRCRRLGGRVDRTVDRFDPATGDLTLNGALDDSGDPVSVVEIRFDEEAPVLAARRVTGTPFGAPLPPLDFRLATTRATNALLERRGAPVALFVTRGFGDLLVIGDQRRPDLFALDIRRPAPLYEAVVEVDERLAADGSVVRPLPQTIPADLARRARQVLDHGIDHAAVVLLHSYLDPDHERRLAHWLRELGFTRVVTSSAVAPSMRVLPRAQTTVVEAYAGPVLERYLARVGEAVAAARRGGGEGPGASRLRVMTSAGGLVPAAAFRAVDGLLSGPAGGVVGAARAARASGFERALCFDMGGTSTDVARFDGDYEYRFEHTVGQAQVLAPALRLETVAAGGGSLCALDGHGGTAGTGSGGDRLTVGPRSAGASPGPACYGAGGPLTLTDVNLLLGRLDPERFEIPLDPDAAARAFAPLAERLGAAGREARDALLLGYTAVADLRMAEAMRAMSVRRGYDPRRYALVAFGGAGAQHACGVAELLGCELVLVPADAGLLSALGLDAAVVEAFAERQLLKPLADLEGEPVPLWGELEAEARGRLTDEGLAAADLEVRRRLARMRLVGQESSLTVESTGAGGADELAAGFADLYRRRYGYFPGDREIEVESMRVVVSTRPEPVAEAPAGFSGGDRRRPVEPVGSREVVLGTGRRPAPVFERSALAPGDGGDGPALVFERHSATYVGAGWRFRLDGAGALVLERAG